MMCLNLMIYGCYADYILASTSESAFGYVSPLTTFELKPLFNSLKY